MDKIFKSFSVVSKTVDAEAGIYEAMISTESVDRQGDIVRATGAKLENYLKNPVVLWAHDYNEAPVARALSIEVIPGAGLKARFQFAPLGASARADETRRLWGAGFLNATSIGFIPLSSTPIDPEDKYGWGPQDFTSWELLEFSIVPVPANQEALRLAIKNLTAVVEKRGRVLSAANEKKIREAAADLQEVLEQLNEESASGDEPVDEGKAESNITADTERRNETIAELILSYVSALKEKI